MTLHNEWVRFSRMCLRGRPREEIAAIKDVFYCGAAAAADAFFIKGQIHGLNPLSVRRVNAIMKELQRFQAVAAARVVSKKERRK